MKIAIPLVFLLAGCATEPAFHEDPDETVVTEVDTEVETTVDTEVDTPTETAEPAPALGACVSAHVCLYGDTENAESDCASLGWTYEPETRCPSDGLIGCCGSAVAHGGAWACYYAGAEAAADAARQSCETWQTEAP